MYDIVASNKVRYQTAVLERLEFKYGKAVSVGRVFQFRKSFSEAALDTLDRVYETNFVRRPSRSDVFEQGANIDFECTDE